MWISIQAPLPTDWGDQKQGTYYAWGDLWIVADLEEGGGTWRWTPSGQLQDTDTFWGYLRWGNNLRLRQVKPVNHNNLDESPFRSAQGRLVVVGEVLWLWAEIPKPRVAMALGGFAGLGPEEVPSVTKGVGTFFRGDTIHWAGNWNTGERTPHLEFTDGALEHLRWKKQSSI
jgi:hypothetical protein